MRSFCYLALAVFVGCSANEPTDDGQSTPVPSNGSSTSTVEPSTIASENVFVIDVRSKSEWDSGHVGQAVHIPHTEIAGRIGEVTDDKDAKIVVYCKVGGRAGKAKEALEELGFTNVENAGGFDDVKDRFK